MNPLQHYLKLFEGTIRWTPSHPEKRNSMSANRSRDDCLNHVADKITTGQINLDIDCQYELKELQAEDIMKDLILPNSLSLQMKDANYPHPGRHTPANRQLKTHYISTKERPIQSQVSDPKTPKVDKHDVHKLSLPQSPHKQS